MIEYINLENIIIQKTLSVHYFKRMQLKRLKLKTYIHTSFQDTKIKYNL